MTGAALMVALGYLHLEDAIQAVDFETLLLLASMMIIVEVIRRSGLLSLMNVRLAEFSQGNPFLIFLIFSLTTPILAAFLNSVTVILIMVPLTITFIRGIGFDPKPFVLAQILFVNIGGAATLIGDPTNTIVGIATEMNFNDFILNMGPVVLAAILVNIVLFYIIEWKKLKPISNDLLKLFASHVLIQKLKYNFLSLNFDKAFAVKSVAVLGLTIIGFFIQSLLNIPLALIALAGALCTLFLQRKNVTMHSVLKNLEWSTFFFFMGLFIMVAGVEHTGILNIIGNFLAHSTESLRLLLLIILWSSAILSMLLDNIPFVTLMIPVIFSVQTQLAGQPHTDLLWWALLLGAVLGGNGTMIGATGSVVGTDIARRHGLAFSFFGFLKYSLPLTLVSLTLSSGYLLLRTWL